ncbi:MAG TPA: methyltransferase domain-containing protein [Methylophilaceae bacterium]|nr:methyltransferase domain-containing protein [Methylophilaceae bacterium]
MTQSKMINIGCGSIHHPEWINLDVASDDPEVLSVDITRGLPFKNSSIDVCYSSHVLEHLDKRAAKVFLTECFRVLSSGGSIRLVVPDLEVIAREYLKHLELAAVGNQSAFSDYDWIMLEMYDQVARATPGGEMANFLVHLPESQRAYVRSRIGAEADRLWMTDNDHTVNSSRKRSKCFLEIQKRWRLRLARLLVRLVAGKSALDSFKRGLFRDTGEVHQWMYDRYSLKRSLEQVGFVNVKVCAAEESRISGYQEYALDIKDGAVRKPDSLFIEASKP